MIKNIDLDDILEKYDVLYSDDDIIDIKLHNDIFKKPIIITGVIRKLNYKVIDDFVDVEFNLYTCYLTDCNDKFLKCNYNYRKSYDNEKKEKQNIIFEFLKENENKKILLQGDLDFSFYCFNYKNNDELYKIYFKVKNVSHTRYNLIINKLQKQLNINYKKDINWNNIKNIAIITDLTNDDAFMFKSEINEYYNCMFFNLIITDNNIKQIELNFKQTLNLISILNNDRHIDLIILLYNDLKLFDLYNLDTFNISKMIYYFNIPFCSIISYKNKHFNNEELVLSKITSYDFINYNYALEVFNEIIKNKLSNSS